MCEPRLDLSLSRYKAEDEITPMSQKGLLPFIREGDIQ